MHVLLSLHPQRAVSSLRSQIFFPPRLSHPTTPLWQRRVQITKMNSMDEELDGAGWDGDPLDLEPEWTIIPDHRAIKETLQLLKPSATIRVKFLAEGALNKVYEVELDGEVFIMRLALPVDPFFKTASEVATLEWVASATDIPVPQVVTYQHSRFDNNPVRFEWILETKMPGKPLFEMWRSMSYAAKAHLVEDFAVYASRLFNHKFERIGSIYRAEGPQIPVASWPTSRSAYSASIKPTVPKDDLDVGRFVSMFLFWGSRIREDVWRGPFDTSNEWMTSMLYFIENDCLAVLDNDSQPAAPERDTDSGRAAKPGRDIEADKNNALSTLNIVRKLYLLLPTIFPEGDSDDPEPEPSVLVHDDLAARNILVHDSGEQFGELSAVLDWECVSTYPLWCACDFPAFLKARPRYEEPDKNKYKINEDGNLELRYWNNLLQYETTLLRDVFFDIMKALEPRWVAIYRQSERERDFDTAVHSCHDPSLAGPILAWIEDLNNPQIRQPRSLTARLDEWEPLDEGSGGSAE